MSSDWPALSRTSSPAYRSTELEKSVRFFAVARVLRDEPLEIVAADFRLQRRGVGVLVDRVRAEGLAGLTPHTEQATGEMLNKRRQGIGQMLLGVLAERRFEELSNQITGGGVLRIEDHRPSRADTDYRLLNGNNNPICRFNVKFHASLFHEARRYVSLTRGFALAAYKINNALRRQEEEKLPYIFLVLSVPDLNAADVGRGPGGRGAPWCRTAGSAP
jgi:hypothetical protein